MEDFSLNKLDKVRYRPTREAEEFLEQLRRTLVTGEKYRVARLAIARSLVEPGDVPLVQRGTEMGTAIEGTHLFGDDTSVWTCLIVERAEWPAESVDAFKQLVEAHWQRGARLLQHDFDAVGNRDVDFAARLAALAGPPAEPSADDPDTANGPSRSAPSVAAVAVPLGEVSSDLRTGGTYAIRLNAPGVSPHVVLLGRSGTGKTRTLGAMVGALTHETSLPLLLLDLGGEFVRDGQLVARDEWGGATIADRMPEVRVVDVRTAPVPLDVFAGAPSGDDEAVQAIARAVAGVVVRALRVRSEGASDSVRSAVEVLLRERSNGWSLEDLRDAIRVANERAGRRRDAIDAKLTELVPLKLFDPALGTEAFFEGRWVVGLHGVSDEARRLVAAMLLAALARWVAKAGPAATDSRGYRALRHVLAVDAVAQLQACAGPSLAQLLERGRAAGQVLLLTAASPEEIDGAAASSLSDAATFVAFASSPGSVKGLRSFLGRRLAPEHVSDKELPAGVALVKEPERDPIRVAAWR